MANSLHRSIASHIISTLKGGTSRWLSAQNENDIQFFLPVTFVLNNQPFLQNFEKPYYLGNKIMVTAIAPNVRIQEDQHHASRANEHYQKKQYEKAIRHLDELIRRNPYNKNPYLMRGNAYNQLGEKKKGCTDFQKITNFLRQPVPFAISTLCP